MRDYLFKGYSIIDHKWVRGSLVKRYYGDEQFNYFITDELEFNPIQVAPESVGQFIGIYDNNGSCIFENDTITNHEDYTGVVEYDAEGGRYWIHCYDGAYLSMEDIEGDYIEIVGNAYDAKIGD